MEVVRKSILGPQRMPASHGSLSQTQSPMHKPDITNRKYDFQNMITTETGLSDFHSMIVSILESGFNKSSPRIIIHHDNSTF